jgi:ribosomal protein S21
MSNNSYFNSHHHSRRIEVGEVGGLEPALRVYKQIVGEALREAKLRRYYVSPTERRRLKSIRARRRGRR